MTARRTCQSLTMRGQETLPPSTLAVLCAAQKLTLARRPITCRLVAAMLGRSRMLVFVHLRRLAEAGLMHKEGYGKNCVWAVACVFIPGERR